MIRFQKADTNSIKNFKYEKALPRSKIGGKQKKKKTFKNNPASCPSTLGGAVEILDKGA